MKKTYYFGLLIILLTSCQPKFYIKSQKKFDSFIAKDSLYKKCFTGVCVYDMETQKYVILHNHDKYFTPASTTKLFTFYAGLKILGNSPQIKLPALQYIAKEDSLIFFGTGNPAFLHPYFSDSSAYYFLKNRTENLYFSNENWKEEHFGTGWSWDDYNDYYSPERSPMPVYGNTIQFQAKSNGITILPNFFIYNISEEKTPVNGLVVHRKLRENKFIYSANNITKPVSKEIPFITSPELTVSVLSDTLLRQVTLIKYPYKKSQMQTLESCPADTLYRRMLQISDNFLAEQILVMCASKIQSGQLNVSKAIDFTLANYLNDLSDKPRWVDGSGLSRMNLFSPRSQVELLLKIYKEVATDKTGEKRLFSLLSANGKTGNGTLQGRSNETYIYGKSGTLSNNVNLSGFLVTKSGKKLCFSFMNNHYLQLTSTVRKEMDKILQDFYLEY